MLTRLVPIRKMLNRGVLAPSDGEDTVGQLGFSDRLLIGRRCW